MTMGTAATMACMVEALGMGMPGNAAIPAVDARRHFMAREAGRRIVQLVHDDVSMSQILIRDAFENAIRTNAAIGGSTNAVVHLNAIARRTGVDFSRDVWARQGRHAHGSDGSRAGEQGVSDSSSRWPTDHETKIRPY